MKQDKSITVLRIKEIMGEETQSEFAAKIHTTQTTISKILTGKTDPSISVLKEISKTYHVSVDWLIGLTENKYIADASTHSLTYPYTLAVINALLLKGNISYQVMDNPKGHNEWGDARGSLQISSLIIHDVVLKELIENMISSTNISPKTAEHWSPDQYSDFDELLDWRRYNKSSITHGRPSFYENGSPWNENHYPTTLEVYNEIRKFLSVPSEDEIPF